MAVLLYGNNPISVSLLNILVKNIFGKEKLKVKAQYVKINASRGYGNDIYKVLKDENDTYTLKAETNDLGFKTFEIYKAHCFVDIETVKYQIEQAKKIGIRK